MLTAESALIIRPLSRHFECYERLCDISEANKTLETFIFGGFRHFDPRGVYMNPTEAGQVGLSG